MGMERVVLLLCVHVCACVYPCLVVFRVPMFE